MQERDIDLSASLRLSAVENILADLYEVSFTDRSKLRARIKLLQRQGWPAAAAVGQGPRAAYWLEEILQLALVFELIELSMTTARAAELTRHFWPTLSNAIANAWIEHQAEQERRGSIPRRADGGDRLIGKGRWSPTLVLIDAQDYDGLNKRDNLMEWQASRSKSAQVYHHRPTRILVVGHLDKLFNNEMSVGSGMDDIATRRAAVVDLTKFVAAVVDQLEERKLIDGLHFEYWCEVLIQTQVERNQE